ncbi:formylglycine-generating enzyme family protein [Candidatus Halobeggiatoa sp. HSG11]|nr:formylglycine-generating enzyme family protein [Candidatus Halobeggiatoa sp. HSG11]
MTLKLIILAIVFVLSGGAAFSEYFRGHKKLSFLATVIAIIATFYLFNDILEDVKEQVSNGNESTTTQPPASKPAIQPPVITEVEPPVSALPTQVVTKPEPPVKIIDGDFTAYFEPKKDEFETTADFTKRRHELLQQFNNNVKQRNLDYQAGILSLNKYNADSQLFIVKLAWQADWLTQFFGKLQSEGIVKIGVKEAKLLKQKGLDKPLFITASLNDNQIKIQSVIVENNRVYAINLLNIKLPKMVKIPAGKFQMGDIQDGGGNDEKPVHWVTIKQPFFMSKYEVTFAEYDAFAEATGRKKPDDEGWGRENRPVINVSLDDAVAYTTWLSQQTGEQYRLPSEAEWEYAARAGTKTKYWWGNDIGKNKTNCNGCGSQWDGKQTAPVGSFQPNQFGLYDTVGNVWEWCADYYQNNYNNAPTDGSAWKKSSRYRVLRGGSWSNGPNVTRAALRGRFNFPSSKFGFRLVGVAARTF